MTKVEAYYAAVVLEMVMLRRVVGWDPDDTTQILIELLSNHRIVAYLYIRALNAELLVISIALKTHKRQQSMISYNTGLL